MSGQSGTIKKNRVSSSWIYVHHRITESFSVPFGGNCWLGYLWAHGLQICDSLQLTFLSQVSFDIGGKQTQVSFSLNSILFWNIPNTIQINNKTMDRKTSCIATYTNSAPWYKSKLWKNTLYMIKIVRVHWWVNISNTCEGER